MFHQIYLFLTETLGLPLNTTKEIIGQCLGLIAMIISISSFQMKTQKWINACQMVSSTFWTASYFLIGAITGSILNIVAVIRALVYVKTSNNNKHYWLIPIIFSAVFIIYYVLEFTILGYETDTKTMIIEALPAIGSVCVSFSLRMKSAGKVRLFYFCGAPLWLSYNYLVGNIFATITELFCMISSIIGMLRLDIKRKNKGDNDYAN